MRPFSKIMNGPCKTVTPPSSLTETQEKILYQLPLNPSDNVFFEVAQGFYKFPFFRMVNQS